jgi:hypothetical protein
MPSIVQPEDARHLPRPPQFSVRTLLIGIAVVGAFCALAVRLPPYLVAIGAFIGLLAAAHVFGNSLGMALRRSGSASTLESGAHIGARPAAVPADVRRSLLNYHHQVRGKAVQTWTIASALVGALLGSVLLIWFSPQDVRIVGICLGTASFALLGGLFGFWAASFLQVFRDAWREATATKRPEATATKRRES